MESPRIQKLLDTQLSVPFMIFSKPFNVEEILSDAREGMELLPRHGKAGKEQKLPFSLSLYRLLAEGVAPNKVECLLSSEG